MFFQRKTLKVNSIYVIYADLSPLYKDFDAFFTRLSEKRQHKIKLISDFNAKVNSLGGALLLNAAASRFCVDADDVKYTEKGKPYIENSGFYFSISHSDGFAACSFGKIPSGCDIQVERSINLKIAERFFSEKEKQFVFNACNPQREFFNVWCKKESAYKLTGVNECIIENNHNIYFYDCVVREGIYFSACAFENRFEKPEELDLNTAF